MPASHGNTPAAWTAVTVMFVGFLISSLALPLDLPWLFFVGLAVVVVGAVTGKVMQMMGMGTTVAFQDHRDPDYEKGRAAELAESADSADSADSSEQPRPTQQSERSQQSQQY